MRLCCCKIQVENNNDLQNLCCFTHSSLYKDIILIIMVNTVNTMVLFEDSTDSQVGET